MTDVEMLVASQASLVRDAPLSVFIFPFDDAPALEDYVRLAVVQVLSISQDSLLL
jgi:hypothetical protein